MEEVPTMKEVSTMEEVSTMKEVSTMEEVSTMKEANVEENVQTCPEQEVDTSSSTSCKKSTMNEANVEGDTTAEAAYVQSIQFLFFGCICKIYSSQKTNSSKNGTLKCRRRVPSKKSTMNEARSKQDEEQEVDNERS
ncbi:hypothetical protein MARPO_0011s0001 [Marchantia polymorpha]|uniref:Uncharacterized protein n=1 Tax=Marchantia polymorpha TaxID=3197 RepID=A0A2R6XJK1_MARPO|nr:hypothetical protein MARPO_0011s0001 [Marchantia polymorpha]|eukprot:PTQ46293.1 hypothetical protein MARPO_0011s0001 [Marchantia polymorpha]